MRHELQNVISGKSQVRYGENIQTALRYLKASKRTGTLDKADKHFKREETTRLKTYIDNHRL